MKAAFVSALSISIVDEHLELWSLVGLHIIDNLNLYEMRVILRTTGASMKFESVKLFTSFKTFQDLYFIWTMPVHILPGMFKYSFHRNSYIVFLVLPVPPHVSNIEHWCYSVGRHPVCNSPPTSSTGEIWVYILTIWNVFPRANIQNLFDFMPWWYSNTYGSACPYTKY
ncbi:hypothetical protein TNCV_5129091 [Trichonephila clavipes]|nr:hypothetical protein TNCV_5129091 [Trichonephila clavipes]